MIGWTAQSKEPLDNTLMENQNTSKSFSETEALMPVVKRFLGLANSRKLSGRCVAGKETEPNTRSWIRPVSDRPHQEVSERERQYKDGSDIRVLDIIDVPLIRAQPSSYQSENWLLDPGYYWALQGRDASHKREKSTRESIRRAAMQHVCANSIPYYWSRKTHVTVCAPASV